MCMVEGLLPVLCVVDGAIIGDERSLDLTGELGGHDTDEVYA